MRTADDAAALRERLRAASRVAVIGGDFAALKLTATATEIGVLTTVIEVAPVPMARVLGDEVDKWFRRLHEHHGVVMVCVWGGSPRAATVLVRSTSSRRPVASRSVPTS
ncbi:FAD-dependent oxidoreductase [Streptomyces sp. Li-HN-5-11]|uniref:FAD-dependent oxidoreductase n=1 Tax=Streptomyces sp. Li-HN-5-11 TaxID=3075432 RepID=UPI0028B152F1|nr:FAD-dependent oxidoreductase [Streptomyces sp. Li-HN-5-11]WNM36530.1 FAD-dependent oxidoreductase [Streptomyces sp. Li-HN-5-11]